MSSWNKKEYWDDKFCAYLHDPIDKPLSIQGHEGRAAEIQNIFGLEPSLKEYWDKADRLASGFERGVLPGYVTNNPQKNGAINFLETPQITHPTGSDAALAFNLDGFTHERVFSELKSFLEEKIGMFGGQKGLSSLNTGKPETFSRTRFFYLHLVLRFMLAEGNIGGLGALWHRLPADTRIPNHSIWHHNALTSALYSSRELAGDWDHVGLAVFSLTPVQGFIAKARKLRDYWLGSVILSWLAFEGICEIIETLGPDHILYPSLLDQPLMTQYLKDKWVRGQWNDLLPNSWNPKNNNHSATGLATFPNKFLALVPLNLLTEISAEVERRIREKWAELGQGVLETLLYEAKELAPDAAHLERLFDRQMDGLWQVQTAAARLCSVKDQAELAKLLDPKALAGVNGVIGEFNRILTKLNWDTTHYGLHYTLSHQLAQSALAAQKLQRESRRADEPGEKCSLCGEFEALSPWDYDHEKKGAKAYGDSLDQLALAYREEWKDDADESDDEQPDLKKRGEKLCAICLTKRWLKRKDVLPKNHILRNIVGPAESFPSTAEMALGAFFKREEKRGRLFDEHKREALAQELFKMSKLSEKENKICESDKYYALLVMDGDHMGRLVNGETISATWKSALHPELRARLLSKALPFDPLFREPWQALIHEEGEKKAVKLSVTPAIHAAISEALGDFALYQAAPIVDKGEGRLIYAGGDDVVAILPLHSALQAARDISRAYTFSYALKWEKDCAEALDHQALGKWKPSPGKLCLGLGNGPEISISAAILVCHYKEPLGAMIERGHELLNGLSKKQGGRNALAMEIRRRSGGPRRMVAKWEDTRWAAFNRVLSAMKKGSGSDLSRSFLYSLKQFEDGFQAILGGHGDREKELTSLMAHLLKKTPFKGEKNISDDLIRLLFKHDEDPKNWTWAEGDAAHRFDAPLMAAFLADTVLGGEL